MVLEPRASFRESLGRVGMVQCCGLASASLLWSMSVGASLWWEVGTWGDRVARFFEKMMGRCVGWG